MPSYLLGRSASAVYTCYDNKLNLKYIVIGTY